MRVHVQTHNILLQVACLSAKMPSSGIHLKVSMHLISSCKCRRYMRASAAPVLAPCSTSLRQES